MLLWLGVLVALPGLALTLAWLRPGRPFSTRDVPADAFRYLTGIAFCAWVDLSLGILAASATCWWALKGWPRISGGLLWPYTAMAVYLALSAPAWTLDAYLVALLMFGVLQTGIAVGQWFGLPIFLDGPNIHGTFGHRTGFGIYLALLVPLAFVSDYGWMLASIYAVGVFLSRSTVATTSAVAGLLWVAPSLWPFAVAAVVAALWYRWLKIGPSYPGGWKLRHWGDTYFARSRIWIVTVRKSREWPTWLVGAGHGAFQQKARTWVRSEKVITGEVYNEAHNDYLEAFYEYGLVGVAALVVWLVRYGDAFALSDPLTGSVLSLAVAGLANFPLRVATLATVALMVAVLLMRRVA